MTRVITASRHLAIAVAAAALLGAAALLLLSPTPASAARHPCPPSEFCLYFNEDANGGHYHYAGSDPNLDNDHYEGEDTGEIVGDTSRYAYWWNNIESYRWATDRECRAAGVINLH